MNSSLNIYNELIIFFFFVSTVLWIGLTLYSGLISQNYLKFAGKDEKKLYLLHIQSNVMWYMRWSALVSFVLSIYLMSFISNIDYAYNIGTSIASLLITIMFLNTWIIIWRKQKSIIAMTTDWKKCESRYDLAIRTNSIFSFPLLALMLYSAQTKDVLNPLLDIDGNFGPGWSSLALWLSIISLLFFVLNLIFGKTRSWMDSPKKIILTGLILTTLIGIFLRYS